MKKFIIALALITGIGFVGSQVFARGFGYGGHMGGYGHMGAVGAPCTAGYGGTAVQAPDAAKVQTFLDETVEQRTALAKDQAELQVLLRTTSPDQEKIQALTESITAAQKELRAKAQELDIAGPGGFYGHGPANCPIQGYAGHGQMMHRGFGHMGGHMGGFGPNQLCPGFGTGPVAQKAPVAGEICH